MNDKMTIFNQYVKIPKDYYLDFEHNYVDDILTIHLKNNQIITITKFTFEDFNKISETQLQSNWNSLREFFENGLQSSKTFKESDAIYEDSLMINKVLEVALDKMNELEGDVKE